MPKKPRAPSVRDAEVGCRVRVQRLAKGLTQRQLGKLIGVTSQQIQRYENGKDRIGSGRLHNMAPVLGMPISHYFAENDPGARDATSVLDFLKTEGAVRLVRAFSQIADAKTRISIVRIVEHMAGAKPPTMRKRAKK
jgi:transcriptional regulator with XRE-family HTH domain